MGDLGIPFSFGYARVVGLCGFVGLWVVVLGCAALACLYPRRTVAGVAIWVRLLQLATLRAAECGDLGESFPSVCAGGLVSVDSWRWFLRLDALGVGERSHLGRAPAYGCGEGCERGRLGVVSLFGYAEGG